MMATQSTLSLQRFFSQTITPRVALFHNGQPLSGQELISQSLKLATAINQYDAQNWGLFCDDASHFIICLLALMASGKTICLPANNQPGTLADLSEHATMLLTDSHGHGFTGQSVQLHSLNSPVKLALTELELSRSSLIFFTSGSSGAPKAIHKQLWQLENEINAQEQTWGERLKDSVILACVAHQHIYGVLFRVLWPLLAHRPIDTHQYQYPESLLAAIAQHNRVAVIASPAQLERLPVELNWSDCHHRVAALFSSGAPLKQRFAAESEHCFSTLPLEILGSTETGGVAWRQQHSINGSSNAWQPLPQVEVKLNDQGLLVVFSPWLDHPETGCAMGDRAEIYRDQSFDLKGRADQIVKIEGKRVSLPEMTRRLTAHPLITQAVLIVIDGGRQQIGAIAVLTEEGLTQLNRNGRLHTTRLLKQALSQYFETVTLPRKWRFVSNIPVNTQGKLIHSELANLFNAGETA